MINVVEIVLVGWREGLQTIAATKLIREQASLDLRTSKDLVESVMEGKRVSVELSGLETAKQFVLDAERLGLIAELQT